MHYYMYEIKNNIDGKIYIGVHKTKKLDDGYMGSGKVIKRAIEKHGIEHFTKTILLLYDSQEAMFAHEKEVVNEVFLARDDVYNIKIGGFGGFDHLNTKTQQNIDRNKNKSIEMLGVGNHFYGKTHSTETKSYLAELSSKQWRGVPKSEEHKNKIAASNTGCVFSDERKKKISESKKGVPSWNKGKILPKVKCPYCDKEGDKSNMKRWHFDNCKERKSW